MTPEKAKERRHQIEALFEEALERDAAGRVRFLDRYCADDAELRAEVEALVAAHERAEGVLESDPARAAAEVMTSGAHSGDQIGRYRVIEELGRGGMGVVYLAESDDAAFRKKVAVKVIPGGLGMDDIHRRFEAERRILASLDHPHIARLLDGGLTEDGRQYLVMEHVDGLPIDEYCNRNRLGIEDRVLLLCTVARAVHYAHRSLVVHRDLKPSNILVMLDPSALGHTRPLTYTGLRLMTPEYASPEQVLGDRITTATDVYGLGVVMFELLTGTRPFRLAGMSFGEWERVILEQEPPKPSAAVVQATEPQAEKESVPREGQPGLVPGTTEVRQIESSARVNYKRRRLRGDLDRIVLMALHKEPSRRYASAEQMAEDVERHLDGDPVIARGDSAAYRARKFVTRHRWGVAAAALGVLSLGGGVIATSWQAREASEQAALASAERDRASRVAGLMMEVFRLSDPIQNPGNAASAREVLDRGTDRLLSELDDEPALQSAMLLEVAGVYEHLGMLDRAESLAVRSLERREEYFGATSLETSESLSRLGQIQAAEGRRPQAIESLRRSVAIRVSALREPDSLLAATQASLAFELRSQGDHEEAAELFEAAVATQRSLPGSDVTVPNTLLGLAATYHDQGAFDEAEALFQSALDDYDSSDPNPMVAAALLNVGMIRRLREQYQAAEPLVKAGYEMRAALYEPDHPDVIEGMAQWGMELQALGRLDEAEAILAAAVERANRKLGWEHETATTARGVLAAVDVEQARYALASARIDTVLAAKRRRHEPDHPSITVTIVQSADPYLETGRLAEARAFLDEAMERTGGAGVYGMLALQGLAEIARREGRLDEADRLLSDAEALGAERLRENHRYNLSLSRSRATLLLEQDRAADAAALLQEVAAAERAKLPEPHPKIGYTLLLLGEAYVALGEPLRVESVLQDAERNLAALPATHWRHGELMSLRRAATRMGS
jgi:serine/threonine-protein kinase